MPSSVQTPLLELETQIWRARAQAKQKWLERSLAEPARSSQEVAQRMTWIKRALTMVKRGQAEIKHQTALMDAYAAHLNAVEMTLISAAEKKTPVASGAAAGRD